MIARNIEGNAAIIQHKNTGLLYDTPQVGDLFIVKARTSLSVTVSGRVIRHSYIVRVFFFLN